MDSGKGSVGKGSLRATTHSGGLARTAMATALIAGAIVTLAVASLIRSHEQAIAQSPVVIEPAPSFATVPLSVPPDSGEAGPFAFGFLEFDWDPRAPGGVPGFDSWPPPKRP